LTFLPKPEHPAGAADASGAVTDLQYVRLGMTVLLGDQKRPPRDAWVDTGAYLTTVPQAYWDLPPDQTPLPIEWLRPVPGRPAMPRLMMLGGSYEFRLGRVRMTAVDLRTKKTISSPVIAKFLLTPAPLTAIVVGLHHGLLDGRRLVVEPGRRAYLEDR
jgi:hypothetical protein